MRIPGRRSLGLFPIMFFLLLSGIFVSHTTGKLEKEDIIRAQKAFESVAVSVEKFIKQVGSLDTLQHLSKLSHQLAVLGPVCMGISAGLSLLSIAVAIGSGKGNKAMDSPEMRLMRDGFEKMDSQLRSISNGIEDLKVIVEKSSARAAYTDAVHSIENLYGEWKQIRDESESLSAGELQRRVDYFKRQFLNNYHYGAKNLWEVFTAPEGKSLLKFDLLDLYKKDSNCNAQHIQQVCLVVIQLLNKGMIIEGAFAGYENDTSRMESLQKTWKIRMDNFTSRCDAFVDNCRRDWKHYTERDLERLLNENYRLPRNELADMSLNRLTQFVQHRSFMVVLHTHTKSTESNTDSSAVYVPAGTDHMVIRNVKGMDLHAFSAPLTSRPNLEAFHLELNRLVLTKSCFPLTKMSLKKLIIDNLLEKYKNFAIYVVRSSNEPKTLSSVGHSTYREVQMGCFNKSYFVFAYA